MNDTLVMNCGTFSKEMCGDSHAEMPIEKERLEGMDKLVRYDVWDRSFVEIKKV